MLFYNNESILYKLYFILNLLYILVIVPVLCALHPYIYYLFNFQFVSFNPLFLSSHFHLFAPLVALICSLFFCFCFGIFICLFFRFNIQVKKCNNILSCIWFIVNAYIKQIKKDILLKINIYVNLSKMIIQRKNTVVSSKCNQ